MNKNISNKSIKQVVDEGDFFYNSKVWFYYKYLSQYKSRFNLLIITFVAFFIIAFFVIYSLVSVLSVKAKNGAINMEESFGSEFILSRIPKIYKSNEKNVIRFVVEKYVGVFEEHDAEFLDVYKLGDKSSSINASSGEEVFNFFETFIKKNYEDETFSGIKRAVKIKSFEFVYEKNSDYDKFIRFIMPEKTPNKALILVQSDALNQKTGKLLESEERLIEISFSFDKIKRLENGGFKDLNFKVLSYVYKKIS